MDKQKMVTTVQKPQKRRLHFPAIEAILVTPNEGKSGHIGICTNTTSPGEALNNISAANRSQVCVLGSLIVTRDGTERMILNSLAHPSLKYLILFSEETATFAPSTNLLLALMHGFKKDGDGNYIEEGVAASPHYPNMSKDIFDLFRKEIIVLPLFMGKSKYKKVVFDYIAWLKPKISSELYEILLKLTDKDKLYYDSLNMLLSAVAKESPAPKPEIYFNPKDFERLQPPTITVCGSPLPRRCPFYVSNDKGTLRVDIKINKLVYWIKSQDTFLLEYSLMKFLGKNKDLLSPHEQLLLGAEIGRMNTEIMNDISTKSFVLPIKEKGASEIPLVPHTPTIVDKKFYYRVSTSDKNLKVMCMAYDLCTEIFELVSKNALALLERLAQNNRFENYEMDILHRMDIGTQIGRASVAAVNGYSFIQDFEVIFKLNRTKLPFITIESDTFLDCHKKVLQRLYTEGLESEHADKWKGTARVGSVLAVYRNASSALLAFPSIYEQASQKSDRIRKKYKKELLRKDHDGTYTYGERTRAYFGFDQLEHTVKLLRQNPGKAAVIQRFDPLNDMSVTVENGKEKYSHDPCLTHDIFFIKDGRLHSFHIARAHNAVNAYPENIFGLHDAYAEYIQKKLGLKSGDMFMLSNRANILMITEEQRTKAILTEFSKPNSIISSESGPFQIYSNTAFKDLPDTGVLYAKVKGNSAAKRPRGNKTLEHIEHYAGTKNINTLKKAIEYLMKRGTSHNNPIFTEYYAGKDDAQDSQMVFFQANAYGKKVWSTAVFVNRSLKDLKEDTKLVQYLTKTYCQSLKLPAGEIVLIYVAYKK